MKILYPKSALQTWSSRPKLWLFGHKILGHWRLQVTQYPQFHSNVDCKTINQRKNQVQYEVHVAYLTPPMSFDELKMVWSLWCQTAALIGVSGLLSNKVGGASGLAKSKIRSTFSAPPVSKWVVLWSHIVIPQSGQKHAHKLLHF